MSNADIRSAGTVPGSARSDLSRAQMVLPSAGALAGLPSLPRPGAMGWLPDRISQPARSPSWSGSGSAPPPRRAAELAPPDRPVATDLAEPAAYFYAILRVVPRLERGEAINAGVVLFARSARYLGLRWSLDPWKLEALAPGADPDPIEARLLAMAAVAEGHPDGGPIAGLTQAERFHWLSSPSSTVVQPSAIHTGLTTNPEGTLHRLFDTLVG